MNIIEGTVRHVWGMITKVMMYILLPYSVRRCNAESV